VGQHLNSQRGNANLNLRFPEEDWSPVRDERHDPWGQQRGQKGCAIKESQRGIDLSSHRNDKGKLVDDDPRRFGFHNLRHSLASFLVRIKTDLKTVQTLLRHSDVKLTLQCCSHSVSDDRMAAAGAMLVAIFSHAAGRSGLNAD